MQYWSIEAERGGGCSFRNATGGIFGVVCHDDDQSCPSVTLYTLDPSYSNKKTAKKATKSPTRKS